ncbi:hypothetical protein [Streptomyces sp. NPDC059513]|uniref:hypothetical protein n=1 Tax=unclassified Streptomyces TaxID=2593676 RepID=UPI0036852357
MSDTKTETIEALGTLFAENSETDEAKPDDNKTTEEKVTEDSAKEKETVTEKSDVDHWKAEARKWEARAKDNGTATTELTKTTEKLEKVSKELAEQKKATETAQAALTRYKVANKYGISDEHTELFLTGSDEETLEKQAKALSDRAPKTPKPDRAQGNRNGSGAVTNAERFADTMSSLGFGA